ncbi:MAG: hypothetical protein ACLP9L_05485 [Thermoguttaceae bacterium]
MKRTAKTLSIITVIGCAILVTLQSYAQNGNAASKDVKRHESKVVTYDSLGRLSKEVFEFDDDLDGKPDRRQTATFEYDEQGRMANKTTEYQDLHTQQVRKEATRFEYDGSGRLVRETGTRFKSNGAAEARRVSSFTYSNNRMATKSSDFDDNADGKVDRHEETVFTYSDKGDLIREVIEKDNHNNGVVDQRVVNTFAYDSQGMVKKSTEVYSGATDKLRQREITDIKRTPSGGTVAETEKTNETGVVVQTENVTQDVTTNVVRSSGHRWFITISIIVGVIVLIVVALRRQVLQRMLFSK